MECSGAAAMERPARRCEKASPQQDALDGDEDVEWLRTLPEIWSDCDVMEKAEDISPERVAVESDDDLRSDDLKETLSASPCAETDVSTTPPSANSATSQNGREDDLSTPSLDGVGIAATEGPSPVDSSLDSLDEIRGRLEYSTDPGFLTRKEARPKIDQSIGPEASADNDKQRQIEIQKSFIIKKMLEIEAREAKLAEREALVHTPPAKRVGSPIACRRKSIGTPSFSSPFDPFAPRMTLPRTPLHNREGAREQEKLFAHVDVQTEPLQAEEAAIVSNDVDTSGMQHFAVTCKCGNDGRGMQSRRTCLDSTLRYVIRLLVTSALLAPWQTDTGDRATFIPELETLHAPLGVEPEANQTQCNCPRSEEFVDLAEWEAPVAAESMQPEPEAQVLDKPSFGRTATFTIFAFAARKVVR